MPPQKGTERYRLWKEAIDEAAAKRRGVPLSQDHCDKISASNTGRIKSQEECNNISKGLKNKPKSDLHKQHLSESLKGRTPQREYAPMKLSSRLKLRNSKLGTKSSMATRNKQSVSMRGDKNPSYKGGITPLNKSIRKSLKYRLWIIAVFERDDYTCQECKKRGIELHAHHWIKEFAKIIQDNNITTLEEAFDCEELWDINNGKTLCVDCHDKKHNRGKYKKQKGQKKQIF